MLLINNKPVSAEEYIIHHRARYDEKLIDIHEFARRLRNAKQYRISQKFLQGDYI